LDRTIHIPDKVVKEEFDRSTEKFQVITAWVGIFLNLFWFISDYFIIPELLFPFLIFRICVSVIAAAAFLLRKKTGLSIYFCMFILVLGISLQNACMWSVMDVANFQKHAFAYMVLFIGVGMLVLWELKFSLMVAGTTIIINLLLFYLYSPLTFEEFLVNGVLITFTVGIFSVFMVRTRYRLIYNDIKIRLELEFSKKIIERKHAEVLLQKKEIQIQKDSLEEKNKEITDSIRYAKNIQNALIPSEEKFNSYFVESFVLFKPKDIVSGDFYWVHKKEDLIFYVTADCSGHGVPGGFMTMLGLSFLNEIITGQNYKEPAQVLNLMREKIISTLNQSGKVGESKDGMDITVCCIQKSTLELSYSAANTNIYLIRNLNAREEQTELIKLKADRQPCGYSEYAKPFTLKKIQLKAGDCLYSFTDGLPDQFGGPKGKKFRYKQFEELLLQNSYLPFTEQKVHLNTAIETWMGEFDQVDDMLVIGVKI
jgi:serine phosphatase RsbU (regulator of sigma subunit)